MRLYFEFPSGWWITLSIIYGLYFFLLILRKSHKNKKELNNQLKLGIIVLLWAVPVEYTGVSAGLWTYFPGNWPIPLIFAYFGMGPLAYQIVKWVEEYK